MHPDTQRQIHIVQINPAVKESRTSRRQARAHSAREVHAQARLRRAESRRRKEALRLQEEESASRTPDVSSQMEDNSDVGFMLDPLEPPPSHIEPSLWTTVVASVGHLSSMDRFLLHHYINIVVPDIYAFCLSTGKALSNHKDLLLSFARLSHTSRGFLNGLLLSACRHMCMNGRQEHQYGQLATRYKVNCLNALNASIDAAKEEIDDSVIANVLILAQDEFNLGEGQTSRNHVLGAVKMVSLRGGPQMLGLDGFLWVMIKDFVRSKGLFDHVRQESMSAQWQHYTAGSPDL